jgi:hypothetical protein
MVFPSRYCVILECVVAIPDIVPNVVFVEFWGEAFEREVVHAECSKLALDHYFVQVLAPQNEAVKS